MNAQDSPNDIFVDVDAESQGDLFSDSRTPPRGIAALHFDNGLDQLLRRSLRAGPHSAPW